jgi:hypothetical protein
LIKKDKSVYKFIISPYSIFLFFICFPEESIALSFVILPLPLVHGSIEILTNTEALSLIFFPLASILLLLLALSLYRGPEPLLEKMYVLAPVLISAANLNSAGPLELASLQFTHIDVVSRFKHSNTILYALGVVIAVKFAVVFCIGFFAEH